MSTFNEVTSSPKVLLYSRTTEGHRGAYIKFFQRLFESRRVSGFDLIFGTAPLLFLMIEDSFLLYVACSLIRSVFGKKTVGLLFRPGPALEAKSIRLWMKRLLLISMKRLRNVTTLTIIPFDVCPGFSRISDGYIYDFQLWDLDRKEINRAKLDGFSNGSKYYKSTKGCGDNRFLVSAIGTQNLNKGFDNFVKLYSVNDRWRNSYIFLFAGRVDKSLYLDEIEFRKKGGVGFSDYVSDEDVLSVYAITDLVWCFYSRDYDQASGILGRAIQFGLPVFVRTGSLMQVFCEAYNISHVHAESIDFVDVDSFVNASKYDGGLICEKFKEKSLSTLTEALGLRK